ncbi:hypothetical protein B1C78_13935 [Thioalkalivibrio denitrificans]|uniref:Uncharacterized protein n=2 Tax=Thioalkalivibrio denitrificans TaxID=108003 RepID=A0A1V3ND30_9GAMM|nr:hypothetical protein B1C78_13935 [Thioalkalivibrio denitrificans]
MPICLEALGTPRFNTMLKEALTRLGVDVLPLQQGLRNGSVSLDKDLSITILDLRETPERVMVRVGAFYSSVLAGCACADDPSPENEYPEYCEMDLEIDRPDGTARISVVGS